MFLRVLSQRHNVPVQQAGGGDEDAASNHGSHDQRDPAEKTHRSLQLQWSLSVAGKKRGFSSTGMPEIDIWVFRRFRTFQTLGF